MIKQRSNLPFIRIPILIITLIIMCACGNGYAMPPVDELPTYTPGPTATVVPTLLPTQTPLPTETPSQNLGWQPYSDGVDIRTIDITIDDAMERITIVRCDPAGVQFKVAYTPGEAASVGSWAGRSGALMAINAGYFTEGNFVTGLTISDGQAFGNDYGYYAGMFVVNGQQTTHLRWMALWPYDPAEGIQQGVQSFPILVKPGGVMGFPAEADDGHLSRRSVIAQDTSGRILFIVAQRGFFSLHGMSVWLAESDLELEMAVNLDGGTSTGLWMPDGPQIDSLTAVPSAILVFPH